MQSVLIHDRNAIRNIPSCVSRGVFWSPRTFIVPFSFSPFLTSTNLSLCAPDALDQTITLSQSVQGIVGLAHGTDEAAEGVDVVLAGYGAARLINLGNRDLNGGVVLGLDDTVGGRALAGDVAIRVSSGSAYRVRSWPSFASQKRIETIHLFLGYRLQIDDLATVVFHFDGWVWELPEIGW